MNFDPALNAVFAALADPTRRAILERLKQGDQTVTALAAPFSLSQPAISQHIKVLEKANLVERRVDGQKRPVSLNPKTMHDIRLWLDSFEAFWTQNFDALETLVAEKKQEGKEND